MGGIRREKDTKNDFKKKGNKLKYDRNELGCVEGEVNLLHRQVKIRGKSKKCIKD